VDWNCVSTEIGIKCICGSEEERKSERELNSKGGERGSFSKHRASDHYAREAMVGSVREGTWTHWV
jgi:hypothetical protein